MEQFFFFFFTTSSAFSVLVVEMPSTHPVNVSIMTIIYTLEKLVLGEVHMSVISWLDPIPLDGLSQLGSSNSSGVV